MRDHPRWVVRFHLGTLSAALTDPATWAGHGDASIRLPVDNVAVGWPHAGFATVERDRHRVSRASGNAVSGAPRIRPVRSAAGSTTGATGFPAHDFARLPIVAPASPQTRSTTESREGEVVTWTQALAPGPDAGVAAANHCRLTGATFTSIPPPMTMFARLNGSRLEAPFVMRATFDTPIPCNCANGEYRQYVRGSFTSGGAPVTHMLGPGRPMSATVFQEDGDVGAGTVYGHRAIPGTKSRFVPDQAGGCQFEGEDEPGITAASGTAVTMQLDFRGELIDTSDANRVVTTAEWSVAGSATIP